MPRGVAKIKCPGTNRQGSPCGHSAGWGTDHKGEGMCSFHGGKSKIKHGIDSKYSSRQRLKTLEQEFAALPNPLDLLPELAKARALWQDFINRYDEWAEGFERWSRWEKEEFRRSIADLWATTASLVEIRELTQKEMGRIADIADKAGSLNAALEIRPERPKLFMDVTASVKIVDVIVKIVDKITSVRQRGMVPAEAVMDLEVKMAMVVLAELRKVLGKEKASTVAKRISEQWGEIQLNL